MQTREMREEQFSIASFDVDINGSMSLPSLFARFQDIAGLHATHLGVGFEKLRALGAAWMLSRIKVRVESLPAMWETVTLRTWPKGVDRLFALRDFNVTSDRGNVLVAATTCWLLVDLEKGKPRRIDSLNVDLQFPNADHAIREIPDKIAIPRELRPIYEKQIHFSDMDINEHVNNAQYVRWVMDCFEPGVLRTKKVKSIQLNYLGQARYGEEVRMSVASTSADLPAQYVEGVNTKTGEKIFQSLIDWGPEG